MIGWVAQMSDGRCIRERNGAQWHEINIHQIELLWLESFEQYALDRRHLPRLLEFIQFKTGRITGCGDAAFESQCIGWTDGAHEIIYRASPCFPSVRMEIHPRLHFHPLSMRIPVEE